MLEQRAGAPRRCPFRHAAREALREAVRVDDDLHAVRILRFRVVDRVGNGRETDVRASGERIDAAVDHVRVDQRFVALHVHDAVGVEVGGELADAVGAARMFGRGHADPGAEAATACFDALVVGDDPCLGETLGAPHPLPDVLDHRLAGDRSQRLAGQPGRRIAGRDGADRVHGCTVARGPRPVVARQSIAAASGAATRVPSVSGAWIASRSARLRPRSLSKTALSA